MIEWHYVPTDHEHAHHVDPGCWCGPKVTSGTTGDGAAAVLIDHRSDTVGPFDVLVVGPTDPPT